MVCADWVLVIGSATMVSGPLKPGPKFAVVRS